MDSKMFYFFETLIGFLLKLIRIHRKSVASCGGLSLLMPYNVLVCSVLKEVRLGAKASHPQGHSTSDYI